MIKFKTITPWKAVQSAKYLTHVQDPVNEYSGVCGKKLSISATIWTFNVFYDENKLAWADRNICLKCLVELGALEKIKAKRVTDKSVISDSLESTNRIETTYKVLVDLELRHNKLLNGSIVKDYEIF